MEVMMVVAILGIIAALAYPNYLRQVAQSRRADAQTTLLETAQDLERCFTETNRYQGCINFPFDSEEGWYEIDANFPSPTQFTITATAQGDQANRDGEFCQWLALSHTGRQTAEDDAGTDTTEACWAS
jgi:type IV pilus assembly protein PilE